MQDAAADAPEKKKGGRPRKNPAATEPVNLLGANVQQEPGEPLAVVLEGILPDDAVINFAPGEPVSKVSDEDAEVVERLSHDKIEEHLNNLYPPAPTIEERAETAVKTAMEQDIEAVLQQIEQVLPAHRETIMQNGHRNIAIALGGIVSAARTTRKLMAGIAYWNRKVHK